MVRYAAARRSLKEHRQLEMRHCLRNASGQFWEHYAMELFFVNAGDECGSTTIVLEMGSDRFGERSFFSSFASRMASPPSIGTPPITSGSIKPSASFTSGGIVRKGMSTKRENTMASNQSRAKNTAQFTAQPRFRQRAAEIQAFGTVNLLPIDLEEAVRLEMTAQLNQVLADTMTLRDLYKKCHWQVAGPTFYQLHLLFDNHYDEQVELVDAVAERIQLLGGVSIAMSADVAEMTKIGRPPRGREEVAVQLSRLLDAHQVVIREVRVMARRASEIGDDGTNDLLVSQVLRTNEMQVWFLSEHLVDIPLVKVQQAR